MKRHIGAARTGYRNLTHCETFRTLRGHAEYLVGVLPQLGGQVEPILPTLAHIRDAGLMRSAEIVAKSLSEHIEAPPLAPLKIFISTCDRPKAVERLLASIENAPTIEFLSPQLLLNR